MPTSTNIRIKIVLLVAKFKSPVIVRRTLQAEFGQDTPSEDTIRRTFQRFCKTGTVEDCERSGRPSTIREGKVDEVRDVCATEPISSVRGVATACSIPQTIVYRIMTEYLSLKPYKTHFVQQIYDEDIHDRVEMCRTLISRLKDYNVQEDVFFQMRQRFIYRGS